MAARSGSVRTRPKRTPLGPMTQPLSRCLAHSRVRILRSRPRDDRAPRTFHRVRPCALRLGDARLAVTAKLCPHCMQPMPGERTATAQPAEAIRPLTASELEIWQELRRHAGKTVTIDALASRVVTRGKDEV